MSAMTQDECRAFLLGQVRTAKLATVRADGRPHLVPVWFELDEDALVFTMGDKTVKAANIRRDPRVCLCVDDETAPFGYVQIEGAAAISTDRAELKYWATRIAGRYMGADLAEMYGERYSAEGEVLARVTITRLIGQKDVVT
jgi:PPOX class probable F420-dependent enzyme